MLSLFATFVFVCAGCVSAVVIGTSLRNALPALRRLAAERRSLAQDRVYLFTLIETPRHDGTPAPVAAESDATADTVATAPARVVRRRAQVQQPVSPARLRAAA